MGYEDFTTYTEVDPNNHITVTASKVTFTDLARNEDAYIYKDYGVDHFNGDFTHKFEIAYTEVTDNGVVGFWNMANAVDDFRGLTLANEDFILMYNLENNFSLAVVENGVNVDEDISPSATGNVHYVTLDRDDDGGANNTGRYTAYIRTGSHTGPLFDTLIVDSSAGEQNDFRYLLTSQTSNNGSANDMSGFVQNLDLQEAADYNIAKISGAAIATISKIFGIAIAGISKISGISVLEE